MVNLYYLIDQAGDIAGAKTFTGSYADVAAAQSQAVADSVAHFSVEQCIAGSFSIVFVC